MDDFVSKPIDADALLAVIARCVQPEAEEGRDERASAPAEPAPSPPPPVLDESQLANVEDLVGREGLQALISSFLSDLAQRIASITADGADRGTIEHEAHALVSLAGNLGFVELSSCSRQLTDACRHPEEANISRLIECVRAAAERARARLQADDIGEVAITAEPGQ
jgi:HPt (histidine-containing phosphotransfer) domain-containing protein